MIVYSLATSISDAYANNYLIYSDSAGLDLAPYGFYRDYADPNAHDCYEWNPKNEKQPWVSTSYCLPR
jgi:hypothetical protein